MVSQTGWRQSGAISVCSIWVLRLSCKLLLQLLLQVSLQGQQALRRHLMVQVFVVQLLVVGEHSCRR